MNWCSLSNLTSVLGVLGTQETYCILIAGLLERDIFDLYLPEFDKPWVIHLRETCCCFTNLCTWRPKTVYKNRSVRRHQRADGRQAMRRDGSGRADMSLESGQGGRETIGVGEALLRVQHGCR
jgi:hypothetical protein